MLYFITFCFVQLNSHPQKLTTKKVNPVQKVHMQVWLSLPPTNKINTQALDELSDFIKYAHPRMKDHQKLLRNLMVLEMVVRILEKFDPNAPSAKYSHINALITVSTSLSYCT